MTVPQHFVDRKKPTRSLSMASGYLALLKLQPMLMCRSVWVGLTGLVDQHTACLSTNLISFALQLVLAIGGTTCIFLLTNILDEILPIYAATPADHGGMPFFLEMDAPQLPVMIGDVKQTASSLIGQDRHASCQLPMMFMEAGSENGPILQLALSLSGIQSVSDT